MISNKSRGSFLILSALGLGVTVEDEIPILDAFKSIKYTLLREQSLGLKEEMQVARNEWTAAILPTSIFCQPFKTQLRLRE